MEKPLSIARRTLKHPIKTALFGCEKNNEEMCVLPHPQNARHVKIGITLRLYSTLQ
jgi:hypothetical protein